ncbi:MAG TPA: hypothetical protein VN967_12480, partial [Burkholderiales bacterium]|nr:hypothetical protein [Burkholderiales bacterium]
KIKAALLGLIKTEDEDHILHPEHLVRCLDQREIRDWRLRLDRLPWTHLSVITLFDGPSSQLFDGSLVWGFRPRRAQACRRAHGRQGRCAPLTR